MSPTYDLVVFKQTWRSIKLRLCIYRKVVCLPIYRSITNIFLLVVVYLTCISYLLNVYNIYNQVLSVLPDHFMFFNDVLDFI